MGSIRDFHRRVLRSYKAQLLDERVIRAIHGQPLAKGYECLVFPAGEEMVRKQYLLVSSLWDMEFQRTSEWSKLGEVDDPHIVRALGHGFRHILLERLGQPLGGYEGIRQVEDPDALAQFLDGVEGALANAGLKHHDIHPGNVLYHPKSREYKLIDFGWARRTRESGYSLPDCINPRYSADDHQSIEKLKREAGL